MRFVTFEKKDGTIRSGWMEGNFVIDMYQASGGRLPDNLLDFLDNGEENRRIAESISSTALEKGWYPLSEVRLKAPIPQPRSFRDFYAFEQHVKTARNKRGLEMVPEWYDIPVFYFSNHLAFKGPGDKIIQPQDCQWLDYELEIGCIIGKEGRNIRAEEADHYIFGFCILNDWSARDLQRTEMKVGLGPAKGKDFSTSIGPWIVTKDELEPLKTGKGYDLTMKARVNGSLLSKGNLKELYYSFGEMIERASADVTLYPGEIIGSGTVGTGCILELGPNVHRWLLPGDQVELEVEQLGVLKNKIISGKEVK